MGAALYLCGLTATPMQPGNEAMYAYPAIEMLRSGDFLIPQYEHGPFLEKPPLSWWVLAASYRWLGVSLFATRLPGALAALLTVALVGLWVRRRSGDTAGSIAALVLLFSFKFATFARTAPADTLLTLFVTLSVLLLDRAARQDGAHDLATGLASGLALALSFAVKGPIGAVIPVGAVLTGLAIDRVRPIRPVARGTPALLLFLALVAPWHWAMTVRMSAGFWQSFYWEHQVLRASTRAFAARIRLPTYYIGIAAGGTFPWFLFLPVSWKSRKDSAPYGWLLFGFLFLSCLALKREVYLMPVLPALAAIVGEHLGRRSAAPTSTRWIFRGGAAAAGCLFLLALRAGPTLVGLAGAAPAFIFQVSLGLLGVAFVVASRSSKNEVSAAIASLGLTLVFGAFLILESRLGRWDPMARWGERVKGHCGACCTGVRLGITYTSLDFYSRFEWHDLDRVECVSDVIRRSGWVVADSSQESVLKRYGRVRVVDRQPFVDENWGKILLRPDRVSTRSLSLMTFESSVPPPESRSGAEDGARPSGGVDLGGP